MTTDYKSSVFLPKTDFPMRGGLPKKEPELLARWADMKLFHRLRAESKGRPKFVLHDGPPYANGAIHIGHALQKTLKTPEVFGDPEGELLVVGWGSTKGVIEEAVERTDLQRCRRIVRQHPHRAAMVQVEMLEDDVEILRRDR